MQRCCDCSKSGAALTAIAQIHQISLTTYGSLGSAVNHVRNSHSRVISDRRRSSAIAWLFSWQAPHHSSAATHREYLSGAAGPSFGTTSAGVSKRMRTERPGATPDGLYWLSQRTGSTHWHRTWFDTAARQTRRASLGVADFQSAFEALAFWWADQRRLRNERPDLVTLAEVLVRYYREYGQSLRSETQIRIACGKLTKHSGALAVSEFQFEAQAQFIHWMKNSGSSAGYIRRTLSVAKAAISWALARSMVQSAPTVILPPDGMPRERLLTLDEQAAIFENATEEHVYRFVVLSFGTWGRPEAVLELTRERCDINRRLVDLNPEGRQQTKKYRPTVPLVASLLPIVTSETAGCLIRWRGNAVADIKTGWRRLRKRAGLDPGVIPYLIRHTMATTARSAGAPPWEVEGWLGHRRPGTTERYAKYAPDYLGRTAEIVENHLSKLPLRSSCVAG